MTMTFHLFRHLLTNQVHNIFKNIDFPSKYNGIGHLLKTSWNIFCPNKFRKVIDNIFILSNKF